MAWNEDIPMTRNCGFSGAEKLTLSSRSPRLNSPPPPPVISLDNTQLLDFRFTLPLKFILIALVLLAAALPAHAATITVGANCTFKQAWDSAFDDSAPSGSTCTAGSGNDTIELNADVVLGETIWEGSAGSGTLTVNGNGYAIRGDGTYAFFGIWGGPTITFNNITFTGAAVDDNNGAAFNPYSGAGTYTFNDCVFHNNRATLVSTGGNGGAINAGSDTTITINRCAFYNNRADTGGAIATQGTITISNSSFYNNRSVREGGAITATQTDTSKRVTLRHVTMINNRGGTDSGALQLGQTNVAHVRNSILYGNTPRDCYIHGKTSPVGVVGKLPNEQGNPSSFIGVSNCDFELRNYGDQRNPQLAGPFNGFYIPRAGSPAINFSTCLASSIAGYNEDQRGNTRPIGSKCDAGAIEHAGYVPPPPSDDGGGSSGSSGDGDGDSSQREAPRGALAPTSTCLLLGPEVVVNDATVGTACQVVEPSGYGHSDLMKAEAMPSKVVDVWGWVTPDTEVCFQGGGSIKFVDTMASSRTISTLPAVGKDGMVCAMIKGAGQVAHVPGPAPSQAQDPPPKAAPQPTAIPSRSLSDCMVKANYLLNMRDAPAGAKIGEVAWNATLTALERTPGWIKVDNMGEQGWIAAMYVEPKGNCG